MASQRDRFAQRHWPRPYWNNRSLKNKLRPSLSPAFVAHAMAKTLNIYILNASSFRNKIQMVADRSIFKCWPHFMIPSSFRSQMADRSIFNCWSSFSFLRGFIFLFGKFGSVSSQWILYIEFRKKYKQPSYLFLPFFYFFIFYFHIFQAGVVNRFSSKGHKNFLVTPPCSSTVPQLIQTFYCP